MNELKSQLKAIVNQNPDIAEKLANRQGLTFDQEGELVGITDGACLDLVSNYLYAHPIDEDDFRELIND